MIKTTEQLNDNTYKFITEDNISSREVSYEDANQATLSPLARKLFGFPWTQSVKINTNSVELTKQDWVDWETLLEPLTGLISEHLEGSAKPIEENPQLPDSASALMGEEAQLVQQFLTTQVNPSLAMHGGWAELKGFESGQAFILMGGGCQGCASSMLTLKEGIETALKDQFSFINEVIDVTDHASGANPYM